jgi:hypothetical protein
MERETNNGKANALGEAVVIYHDPDHINTDLAKVPGSYGEASERCVE